MHSSRLGIHTILALNGPHQAKKSAFEHAQKCGFTSSGLIRPFALHSNILLYPMILLEDSEGPGQTAYPLIRYKSNESVERDVCCFRGGNSAKIVFRPF